MVWSFLTAFIVTTILSLVFLGIWVYIDATYHGMKKIGWWVALAVLFNPPLGLILYLVFRKDLSHPCSVCGDSLRKKARFCDNCGEVVNYIVSKPKKKYAKWLVFSGLSFILMITSVTTFVVLAVVNNDFLLRIEQDFAIFDDISVNIGSVTRRNTMSNGKWGFDIITLGSGSFRRTLLNNYDSTNYLVLDIEKEQGNATIELTQGNHEYIINLDEIDIQNVVYVDLSDIGFETGRIRVTIRGNDVRNLRGSIFIE